jgi:hypothetical protein
MTIPGRGVAVLLAIALVACAQPPQAEPPRESAPVAAPPPTVAPTAPPTPAPTAPPVTAPQPPPEPAPVVRPRPTTRRAGQQMLPYYAEVRQLFPILPVTVEIMFDEPAGTDANAVFHGLNVLGQPRFAVREDFVLDRGTAAHEIGHAYQKILERSRPVHIDVLAPYWAFRGFPGTWQEQLRESEAQGAASAKWIWSPIESWAEAFRAAVTLERKERTLDYGKTIDPAAARVFFQSLMPAAAAR